MTGENEQNTCDADERRLHEWGAQMDMETKSYQERARRRGLPISREIWIGSSARDYSYLEKKSVSGFERLNDIHRFIISEERRVIITLGDGIVRICVHRLPRNEEEERIIQHMLTLLSTGREANSGIIAELLPLFERRFGFSQFVVDYSKDDGGLSGSETFQLIMASLTGE